VLTDWPPVLQRFRRRKRRRRNRRRRRRKRRRRRSPRPFCTIQLYSIRNTRTCAN